MNINKKYFNGNLTFLYALGIILISRFLPHPPNFTPIISLAILMPIFFKKRPNFLNFNNKWYVYYRHIFRFLLHFYYYLLNINFNFLF